jgi:arabinogalactan endo-1,4-beta-galactosidase
MPRYIGGHVYALLDSTHALVMPHLVDVDVTGLSECVHHSVVYDVRSDGYYPIWDGFTVGLNRIQRYWVEVANALAAFIYICVCYYITSIEKVRKGPIKSNYGVLRNLLLPYVGSIARVDA